MAYARRVFGIAAIHGVIVLMLRWTFDPAPPRAGAAVEPATLLPEFVPLLIAMSALFALVASEPMRYRALMLVGVVQKAGVGGATLWLHAQQRLPPSSLGASLVELGLACLFVVAYVRTASVRRPPLATTPRERPMFW